nr:MAG TPA: hypothetical protein [Caudoviricetes sp.]
MVCIAANQNASAGMLLLRLLTAMRAISCASLNASISVIFISLYSVLIVDGVNIIGSKVIVN